MRERHPAYFKNVWEKSKANLDGLATTKMTADGHFSSGKIPYAQRKIVSIFLVALPSVGKPRKIFEFS